MRMKKRILGLVRSFVLMLGLLPGMSLTAYAQTIHNTDLTVGKTLAKGDVISFARGNHKHNGVIEYYYPFNLMVYMDGSIVKSIETGVSTPQQYCKQDREYTVLKKCSVVSYSDNLQDNAHDHTIYLKSME